MGKAYERYLEEADDDAHGGFDEAAWDRWQAAEALESPPLTPEEELAFEEALLEASTMTADEEEEELAA